MTDVSDYLALELLDHTFRGASFTPPSSIFASLHTADPGETGTSEASGGSYGRQSATFATAALDGGVPTIKNNASVTFLDMPAGTFSYLGFWDDSATGNFLWKLLLTDGAGTPTPVTTTAGEAIAFDVSDIVVELD